jgi:RNA polymerase sigma-70 factor, ECF subfamily
MAGVSSNFLSVRTLVVSPSLFGALVALDEALQKLSEVDARQSQVVEMRFFGGLSVEETAAVLKVSPVGRL